MVVYTLIGFVLMVLFVIIMGILFNISDKVDEVLDKLDAINKRENYWHEN